MSELVRSFIAVKVPAAAAEQIRSAQERLRAVGGGWKWVNADSFHITLKFLGAVERSRLAALWRSMQEAVEGTPAFTVTFRGVGAFPSRSRARVVWAGVERGAADLAGLAVKVDDVCAAHGFEREKRPFRAHLTLGRARRPGPDPTLAEAMKELAGAPLGETCMDRVLLMKSELSRSGAVYSILNEEVLAGGDAA